jgi:hypothetical protein
VRATSGRGRGGFGVAHYRRPDSFRFPVAGLRVRRVHLDRSIPVLQVLDTRYRAGRFGSGFKPRPKSDTGIRELPLAPVVVQAIRRQHLHLRGPHDLPWSARMISG